MSIKQLELDLGEQFKSLNLDYFSRGYQDYNISEVKCPKYIENLDYMAGWDKARKEHHALIEQRNLEVQRKYCLED